MGRYSVVQVDTPEHGLVNLGVLLQDPETDSLRLRVRRDLESLAGREIDEEDLDVLEGLAQDLDRKAQEMGAEKLFEYLESNLSNAIRITDREEVLVDDFDRAVDRLYRKNVQSNVLEFRTHLPKYSLRAAAGKFLENAEISEDGWVEAPEDLRLTPGMFVAEIAGHSMEPRIPDGSLCVFRNGVVGSRTGRLVLAEQLDAAGNNRYAVKRYRSDTTKGQKTIKLESLNREYPDWPLDPDEDKYRIIAEFVRVLD
ncbi:MAG TPA: S24 family peptidase [Bryobacteraceae bacterium]|nr:S24 family peptidase [Bryobacteraceae bacterium]